MSSFAPVGSSKVTAQFDVASNPIVANVAMPLAGTEYSYPLPTGCKQFLIKSRMGSTLNVAYISGDTSTTYITVSRNCFYGESEISTSSGLTIYFQSSLAGETAEIITWT